MEQWKMSDSALHNVLKSELEEKGKVTIYTVVKSVAKSGMSRRITSFIIDKNGYPVHLTDNYLVKGCGMDMCFELSYRLFESADLGKDYPYQKYLHNMKI